MEVSLYVFMSLLCERCSSVNFSHNILMHISLYIGLCRICSCANVRYVIIFICSLPVGVDSVADKLKLESNHAPPVSCVLFIII